MAKLELDNSSAAYLIRSYQPGRIQINETTFTHSLIITPTQLITDWPPQTHAELTPAQLSPILTLKPDVLLIGTGASLVLLPVSLYGDLINLGIGVEVMDTSAACRTFNALAAEERRVAAALIIS